MNSDMQQKPLWTVLDRVYWDDLTGEPSPLDAEEWDPVIETLADWLVPEEPEPLSSGLPYPEFTDGYALGAHQARQRIRQRLLDEARRCRGD